MSSQKKSIMSKFGDKIRTLRESKSMLLRELASEIKIDQALLSKRRKNCNKKAIYFNC